MNGRATSLRTALVCAVLGLSLWTHSVCAQQDRKPPRPVVVLTRLSSPSGDPVARNLAAAITASIQLVMRMTGSVTVRRADFLLPSVSFGRALGYYRETGANGAIYGSVRPTKKGGYAIRLGLWNGNTSNTKPQILRRSISNILSSFRVADTIALKAASTIIGRKLSEGRLVIRNVAGLSAYSVYADGHLLGRNRSSFPVLTGKREIIVARPGPIGDIPIETFRVDIRAGKTATVALSMKRRPQAKSAATRSILPGRRGAMPSNASETVYVAGVSGGGSPTMWTNGTPRSMALGEGAASGTAYSVAVGPRGNLFVAGSEGSKKHEMPVYWENGRLRVLPTLQSGGGRVLKIDFGRKDDVYLAGASGPSPWLPVYWKNGRLHRLPGSGIITTGRAVGVAVDRAGTVSAAGYLYFVRHSWATPEVWAGATLADLISPKFVAGTLVSGMAEDARGNMTISGSLIESAATGAAKPVVWSNGWFRALPVPTGATKTVTAAVAVDPAGNSYVVGYDRSTPLLWENGEMYALPTGAGAPQGEARSVAIDAAGNVFVAGWIGTGNSTAPVYWKNGRLHRLAPLRDRASGRAYAIAILAGRAGAATPGRGRTGRIDIMVKPAQEDQGTIKVSIEGPSGRVNATGTGGTPLVLPLAPGDYSIDASFSTDTGIGFHTRVTIDAGHLARVTIPLAYSKKYRIGLAERQRSSLRRELTNLEARRRSTTITGFVFDGVGVLGGVAAGVTLFLSLNAASPSTARAYRGAAIGSGAAGLLSFVIGALTLRSRHPVAPLTSLRKQISTLDAQIRRFGSQGSAAK